ncbi:hypothetical protein KFK09_016771 [Dendrobium nobile]|uniref:Uncharacterized protein n=1 Tax=Dendrobium nobile TaxID=94219 RepID=A0A8T3AZ31_DENNO|nr:hypothetical protein KFK09_016771 [Dendrobium nobile]
MDGKLRLALGFYQNFHDSPVFCRRGKGLIFFSASVRIFRSYSYKHRVFVVNQDGESQQLTIPIVWCGKLPSFSN